MIDDRSQLDEADLRFHSDITLKVYGRETIWIADVSGDSPETALVSLGFKNVTIAGSLRDLLDRFRAAVVLLEAVEQRREDWDLLLPRRRRNGIVDRRTWAHPFRDPPQPAG